MSIADLFQSIITTITDQNFIAKLLLMIFIFMYMLFTIVLARQIFVLNNIVNQVDFSPIFKLLAIIHVGLAIALLFFTISSL